VQREMAMEVVDPENGLHNGLETRPSGRPALGSGLLHKKGGPAWPWLYKVYNNIK